MQSHLARPVFGKTVILYIYKMPALLNRPPMFCMQMVNVANHKHLIKTAMSRQFLYNNEIK